MVQTRSSQPSTAKPKTIVQSKSKQDEPKAAAGKRKLDEDEQPQPQPKTAKADDSDKGTPEEKPETHKLLKVIDDYGTAPLDGLGVDEPLQSSPAILLAIVIDSMLRSTRISHDLAQKASARVFKAGYYDIETLSSSSWDERVQVLSEGGYNRYRERTATLLGDLAALVSEKYDGDLNNLLAKAGHKPAQIRQLIREIKGLGDVAVGLFCDDAQAIWPVLAPTIDHRSLDTADQVGIGRDIEAIYAALGRDPVQMSRLARGLSAVRLSKRQGDIEAENS